MFLTWSKVCVTSREGQRKGSLVSGNRHSLKKKGNFVGFLPSEKKKKHKKAREWISVRWAIITGKATFQSFYVFCVSRERSLNRKLISKVSSLLFIRGDYFVVTKIASLSLYTATNPWLCFFWRRRELSPSKLKPHHHPYCKSFFHAWFRFHGNIIVLRYCENFS